MITVFYPKLMTLPKKSDKADVTKQHVLTFDWLIKTKKAES